MELPKKDGSACAAATCENRMHSRRKLKFFKFPDDPERIRNWLQSLRRTDLLDKLTAAKKLKVCEEHFAPNMIDANKSDVSSFAVPFLTRFPLQRRRSKAKKDARLSGDDMPHNGEEPSSSPALKDKFSTSRRVSSPIFMKNTNGPVIYSPQTAGRQNAGGEKTSARNIPHNCLLCEVCRRLVSEKEASKFSYVLPMGWRLNLCLACEKNLRGLKGSSCVNKKGELTCSFCKAVCPTFMKSNPTAWHPNFRRLFKPATMDKSSIDICDRCKEHINHLCSRMWNACRICGKTSISLIDIIETASVLKHISMFANISISPLDGLPNYICSECNDDLDKMYKLYMQIIKMNDIFKTIRDESRISYEFNRIVDPSLQNGTAELNTGAPEHSGFLIENNIVCQDDSVNTDDSLFDTLSAVENPFTFVDASTGDFTEDSKPNELQYNEKRIGKTKTRKRLQSKEAKVVSDSESGPDASATEKGKTRKSGYKRKRTVKASTRKREQSKKSKDVHSPQQLTETNRTAHNRKSLSITNNGQTPQAEVTPEIQPLLDSSFKKTCLVVINPISEKCGAGEESACPSPELNFLEHTILSDESEAAEAVAFEEMQDETDEEDYVVNTL